MLDSIKELFATAPFMAWSLVSVLLAVTVIVALWDQVKWWALNTWMSFPIIGRIARWSKDTTSDTTDKTWFKSEKRLCRKYKEFVHAQDEYDFNNNVEYLTLSGDNGRKPMPFWIWLLTVVLVFIEAMGFSYVLAGYTIPGASENLQQTAALGIAFMVSVVLVAFTHWAGHELYVSTKIKHAREEWGDDGRKGKFSTVTVPLAKPQDIDADQESYTRLANRVGTRENYKVAILTVIIVLIVGIGATYVRGQVLEKSLQDSVVGTSLSENKANFDDAMDMSAESSETMIPTDDLTANNDAKKKAIEDGKSIDRHGGWGTFIMLAFIFVFLQLLSGLFGYKWGFAGPNGYLAFKATGGGKYASYADVKHQYDAIADVAQSKLESLQQKFMRRNANIGNEGIHTTNTFRQFMELARAEKSKDRNNERGYATQEAKAAKIAHHETHTFAENTASDIDAIMDEMSKIITKDGRKVYVSKLSEEMKHEVMSRLKKQAEEKAKLDDELDQYL